MRRHRKVGLENTRSWLLPIDGSTVSNSHPVLRERTAVTVSLGLTGELCLHMDQTPVLNEVIGPTPSEVAWARDFLADFEARGQVIRDGSDEPRLGRTREIERLAQTFGVQPA